MKLKILGSYRFLSYGDVCFFSKVSSVKKTKARNELIESEVLTGASICNLSNLCWWLNVEFASESAFAIKGNSRTV